ncbi:MAG: hypothetical protein K6E91_07800 [Butyrivibrio sp.]|nr:hypothetical protein [Butyrivibrio sp.]
MFIVVMLAFLLLSAFMAHKTKKHITQCTSIVFAGVILTMYVLAFFRALDFLWIIAAFVIPGVMAAVIFEGKEGIEGVLKKLTDPIIILLGICTLAVGLCASEMVFTWWDDINYWSSDAKQLFFLNGFPGKYGNVSPEFGDYPPVTSLVKWLFLQLGGSSYNESLQFLGYFFANAVFMLPLVGKAAECIDELDVSAAFRALLKGTSFLGAMLLPGVFNGIIYYGTPADITMAIVYGALLLSIYDDKDCTDFYYYARIAMYTAVFLLTKSIGFEWAMFALAFYFLWGRRKKRILISALFAGTFWGSWLLFCFVNRRVAKLTGAGIKMATSGSYSAPDNAVQKLVFFAQGFLFEPMHADHNMTIDLSTGAFVVLIFLAVVALHMFRVINRREMGKLMLFLALSAVFSYAIVFAAHITIFQTEDQYLEPYAMAVSIARYCSPFALGGTYLIMGMCFDRLRSFGKTMRVVAALCAALAFVFLTADYSGLYRYLIGYRADVQNDRAYCNDMIGEDGFKLIKAVDDRSLWGKRVLVLRDGHSYYWVHNTYISKEASPVALVYDVFLAEEDTGDGILKKIADSHAGYFYVEDDEGAATDFFKKALGMEDYEPGRVISIEGKGF